MKHPGEENNRRSTDHSNWFVRAGGWARSAKAILWVFGLLIAASILFQYTAQRDDVQNAQDQLDQLTTLVQNAEDQRKALQEQAELILDCTKAGGKCFEEGAARTADVVESLNLVTQFSTICGERLDGEEAILQCVEDEVTKLIRQQKREQQEEG